ncbi:hypothetical protein FB566_1157 [Stackebrandtia endophytica]|uniref:Deazaflavin-dependent oxidoreductase (Nitroreductase family) n=1 Tax=Stackebrandtia endophytica TaxID=1496996 RepID=A0A543ASW4_9ACTN|nr:hypothetical protein [Stackebrandtia endophytica]TQL75646.1 hypothetical protein FB566_1157 [Stackebrandtia endophytica]
MSEPTLVRPERNRLRRLISLGNRWVRMILRSRFHRLLSGRLMLLTYTGAKTGREYTIPLRYHRWGVNDAQVLAMSGGTRWPDRVRGREVRLRIAGQDRVGRPEIIEELPAVVDLLESFVNRYGPSAGRALMIGLPGDRHPSPDELSAAATKSRWVRFTLNQ